MVRIFKKHGIFLLSVLMLLLLFCGCKIESVEEHNNRISSNADNIIDEYPENQTGNGESEESTSDSGVTINISITCKDIIEDETIYLNGAECKNGIIYESTISVKENSSLFDILIALCSKNNIQVNYTGSGNSVYISSINNISEKEYGRYSGWMYKVNDVPPSVSVDSYIIKEGDTIEFYYVTSR